MEGIVKKCAYTLVFLLLFSSILEAQVVPENPIKLTKIEATKEVTSTHLHLEASVLAISS